MSVEAKAPALQPEVSLPPITQSDRTAELAECGWRFVDVIQPNGTTLRQQVSLFCQSRKIALEAKV